MLVTDQGFNWSKVCQGLIESGPYENRVTIHRVTQKAATLEEHFNPSVTELPVLSVVDRPYDKVGTIS